MTAKRTAAKITLAVTANVAKSNAKAARPAVVEEVVVVTQKRGSDKLVAKIINPATEPTALMVLTDLQRRVKLLAASIARDPLATCLVEELVDVKDTIRYYLSHVRPADTVPAMLPIVAKPGKTKLQRDRENLALLLNLPEALAANPPKPAAPAKPAKVTKREENRWVKDGFRPGYVKGSRSQSLPKLTPVWVNWKDPQPGVPAGSYLAEVVAAGPNEVKVRWDGGKRTTLVDITDMVPVGVTCEILKAAA